MTGTFVLIVDDDPDVLPTLKFILTSQMKGVTVHFADSGRAALDLIAAMDYDAVVSDIVMSEMDGLALLEKIRTIRPGTPVLLITGYEERELILQALRGGAYDFLEKPIDHGYFLAAVARAIQMRRLSRQVEEQKAALERHASELEQMVRERTRELLADIAERKRAEEALRESEERFRGAFDNAPIGMSLNALDGRWLKVNRSLCEIVGYAEQELLATNFQSITHPGDLEPDLSYVRKMLTGELQTYQMEKRYIHKLGHIVWIQLNVSLVRDPRGTPIYFIAQIQNITARKNAEVALRETAQQLSQLLEDRRRISRDLHDNIIQAIYAIGLGLEECRRLMEEDSKQAAKMLGNAIGDLNAVIRDVRSYISWSEPKITSGSQLKAAIERLDRTMEGAQLLNFRLHVDPKAGDHLTADEANHILYIAREAMSNSLRHSRARSGSVSLQMRDGHVLFQVEDDGVGFDAEAVQGHGEGLRNLVARAEKLGARLDVISQYGRGTRIVIDIPKESEHASA